MEVFGLPWTVRFSRRKRGWSQLPRLRALGARLLHSGACHVAVLTLFGSLLLFWNLGRGSVADWDEAFYGGVAAGMWRTGDWITPRWNGYPLFDKPPLYMWLTALVMPILGVNEFAIRFWAAAFGVLGIVLTYRLARDLHGPMVGMASAVVLASMPGYLLYSSQGMLDIPVASTSLLSLVAFHRASKNRRYYSLVPLALALGFMLKFGMGLLPLPAFLLYALWKRDLRWFRRREVLWGGLAAAASVVPWLTLGPLAHGGLTQLNGFGLWRLLAIDSNGSNSQPLGFYVGVLQMGLGPWVLLAVVALVHLAYRLAVGAREGDALLGLWLLVIVVVFFPAPTKLPWYIVSAYPVLAIQIGVLLKGFLDPSDVLAKALVLPAAAWRVLNLGPLQALPWPGRLALAMVTTALVGFPLGLLKGLGRLPRVGPASALATWARVAPVLLVLGLVLSTLHLPSPTDDNADVKVLSHLAGERLAEWESLAIFSPSHGDHENSVYFYSQRHVLNFIDPGEAARLLASPSRVLMITTKADLVAIPDGASYKVIRSSGEWLLIRNHKVLSTATTQG